MRKILKTAASLVLCCALLSVSAFAAITPGDSVLPVGSNDDIAAVEVGSYDDNDQATILVIKGDVDTIPANLSGTTQILYIDQLPAEGGYAEYSINFGDYIGVATVFAGGTSSDTAVKLGTISNIRPSMFVYACTTEGDASTAIEAATLSAVGDTQQLYAVLNPAESNDWVGWSAEGAVSVEVDEETGVATVTALEEGTGTVTLTAGNDGEEEEDFRTTTVTYTVGEVATGAESISIKLDGADVENASINILETIEFSAEVEGTATEDIAWSVNDDTAGTIENGLYTPATFIDDPYDGTGIGEFEITATVDGKSDTVTLRVWRFGDVDGDGYVTSSDAISVLFFELYMYDEAGVLGSFYGDPYGLNKSVWAEAAADVDGDGFATSADAVEMAFYELYMFDDTGIDGLMPQ